MSEQPAEAPRGALDGVFVLDLSRVLAGPWATQLLGDMGADVVKVERPQGGDDTRGWGPPFTTTVEGERGDSAYFMCANRNKRSLAVDMATPEGAEVLRRLAAQADVVVENFKTGGLAKYGLDYASLATANPRLVYCSITGFGQTGPWAERAGYDYLIQAMGGLMSVTGQPDGAPGAEPMKAGVAVADLFTGLYASSAILAALLHARATGQGQHIDLALYDVQAAMLANQATNWLIGGKVPGRMGNAHPNLAPYQVFQTADGAAVIAVGNDGQFRALCQALGTPDLVAGFATNAERVDGREALLGRLAPLVATRSTDGLIAELEAAGVPCGPINGVDRVFAGPQAEARALVVEQSRDDLQGAVRTPASPAKLSGAPLSYRRPPPQLGAHTAEVLAERLGLSEQELAALRNAGACP
jgi:crotonobetainyl-CoA:carnitine CoA-transferase CaiB-like acyl-CoA transferase